ncbi:hypothetical protein GY21_03055 [Cryobacterium roopkundense]|uniref:HutD-family protein n=1 Tax=Cryobacterium roopkundense TaxID=1001240 RepID=A0A099JRU8_9MICO|nr:HutD family protein [Cryobacterium roopkundense]KGJ80098.1 hypothetical protein GY21_03055 [Cryobacterium roopkundense]MBB5641630.1 hypothetical protein [Cryobacterium roopkundense]
MEIIRYRDLKPASWRNGGGSTREVASFPIGAPDFDWRISIADVDAAGDFSAFPGVDRILTLIDGDLLVLTVDGVEHAMERYRPFRFSGDSATSCMLPVGATRDLNVMSRRSAVKAYLSIVELSKTRAHPIFADQFGILLQGNAVVASGAGDSTELGTLDAVRGDEPAPEVLGRGFLAVVTLEPLEPTTELA